MAALVGFEGSFCIMAKSTFSAPITNSATLLIDKDDILAPFNNHLNTTSIEQQRLLSASAGARAEYQIQVTLGPLALTDSISVDTEEPVNLQPLLAKIQTLLEIA